MTLILIVIFVSLTFCAMKNQRWVILTLKRSWNVFIKILQAFSHEKYVTLIYSRRQNQNCTRWIAKIYFHSINAHILALKKDMDAASLPQKSWRVTEVKKKYFCVKFFSSAKYFNFLLLKLHFLANKEFAICAKVAQHDYPEI